MEHRAMTNSVEPRPSSPKTTLGNVTYLPRRPRLAAIADAAPFRPVWTEYLERRCRAVARWRGSDVALKEKMLGERR